MEDDRDALHVVCYPPTGIVPLELMRDARSPWTIMPDKGRYQPTEFIRVRMWRCRIARPADGAWSAERLDEVSINHHIVDCSTCGNPFCVAFWPKLGRVSHGEQFEVLLEGLRGEATEMHFFHEFHAFRQVALDKGLATAASRFRKVLGSFSLWGNPSASVAGPGVIQDPKSPRSEQSRAGFAASRMKSLSFHSDASGLLTLGLVSHPQQSFVTTTPELTIVLCSQNIAAIVPSLSLFRGDSYEQLHRTVLVYKFEDRFLVRVKLPLGGCIYELKFAVSTQQSPGTLLQHPLRYWISAADECPNILLSLEHPLSQKFGYVVASPAAQVHGISFLAPDIYRVTVGPCYFLVHVDPDAQGQSRNSVHDEHGQTGRATLFEELLRRGQGSGSCAVWTDFHSKLRESLEPCCQEAPGGLHLDLSVQDGKYVVRMRRRRDFPEFYEAWLRFSEDEASHHVDLFARPATSSAEERAGYAPISLARWLICVSGPMPKGFE